MPSDEVNLINSRSPFFVVMNEAGYRMALRGDEQCIIVWRNEEVVRKFVDDRERDDERMVCIGIVELVDLISQLRESPGSHIKHLAFKHGGADPQWYTLDDAECFVRTLIMQALRPSADTALEKTEELAEVPWGTPFKEAGWVRPAAIVCLVLATLGAAGSAWKGGGGDFAGSLFAAVSNPLFFIGLPLGLYFAYLSHGGGGYFCPYCNQRITWNMTISPTGKVVECNVCNKRHRTPSRNG